MIEIILPNYNDQFNNKFKSAKLDHNITTINYRDVDIRLNDYNPLPKDYIDTIPNFIKDYQDKFEWIPDIVHIIFASKYISEKQVTIFSLFCINQIKHLDPWIINALNCIEDYVNKLSTENDLMIALDQAQNAHYDIKKFYNDEERAYKKANNCKAPHAIEYRNNALKAQQSYEDVKLVLRYIISYLNAKKSYFNYSNNSLINYVSNSISLYPSKNPWGVAYGAFMRVREHLSRYAAQKMKTDIELNPKKYYPSSWFANITKSHKQIIYDAENKASNTWDNRSLDYLLNLFERGANLD